MSIRKVPLVRGEYYHIYNRGNNKHEIFIDDEDRDRFIKLLYLCNSTKRVNYRDDIVEKKIDVWDYNKDESIISIGAWVLMPNHFHLYLTSPKGKAFGNKKEEENMITVFMGKLCTSYTMYFNKKHGRTGSLFEGKFKSVHISMDTQAKYLFSYIHLNPIKLIQKDWKVEGIKNLDEALDHLKTYQWSSYHDHKKKNRKESKILNLGDFPKYFPKTSSFDKEIMEWLISFSPKARPLGN